MRAGHEAAFEAIVARYRRPLLRYCGGILSGGRAEDAVQQTFLKAYDAMRRGDGELNLRPWLYRIAHNTALNALRHKSLTDQPLDPQMDGVERPDQAAERRQGVREVLTAVEALPTRQRDAIVLRELEGRSYEEIAGALGVTGGAVRQLLNRARTTLRAAATAITPIGLLLRVPFDSTGDPVSGRVAELVGGAGATVTAGKIGTAMLVTGAVAGGVAAVPAIKDGQDPAAPQASAAHSVRASDEPANKTGPGGTGSGTPTADLRARGHGRDGRLGGHDRRDDRRGGGGGDHGGRAPRSGDDHSGAERHGGRGGAAPGHDHGGGDHSGSGGGGGDTIRTDDHSGSGSGSEPDDHSSPSPSSTPVPLVGGGPGPSPTSGTRGSDDSPEPADTPSP